MNIPGWIEVVQGWVYVTQVIAIQPMGVLRTRVKTASQDFEYIGTCSDFAREMEKQLKNLYKNSN